VNEQITAKVDKLREEWADQPKLDSEQLDYLIQATLENDPVKVAAVEIAAYCILFLEQNP
jgi:hypothetical protein